MSRRAFTISAVVIVAAAAIVVGVSRARPRPEPAFVGAENCAQCHRAEFDAWNGSQHAVAMQAATPKTVLGDFADATMRSAGADARFSRRGDAFIVTTEGPNGKPADFEVRYTFGVAPLQQYLATLGGGRIQVLPAVWDTRPKSAGGQRWFSLERGPRISHDNEWHWTGREPNWNYMCADCHSTAVRKGYDAVADSFTTKWSAINVSCEACHGPGSEHASWGRYPKIARSALWADDGLISRLTERRGAEWNSTQGSATAHRSVPRTTDREIETCAQCHASRVHIADGYVAGKPLMDYYSPLGLSADAYHPDGQQRDEVYTYASFLQSKMYSAGVTCSDCHDPHTQKLRRASNGSANPTCAQCHTPAKFDTSAHHFHRRGSAGSQCVSCHMPDTTYMEIDPRHDHSLRIPRPDLTIAIGVPNPCTRCHTDRDARWAADEIRRRYPNPKPGFQRFALAFAADDYNVVGALDSLLAVAGDTTQPMIVRSSALDRLRRHPSTGAQAMATRLATAREPLIRRAALTATEGLPPDLRIGIAAPALRDSLRAIRIEAVWLLTPVAHKLSPQQRADFDRAAKEFVASHRYNGDRPVSRITLGSYYAALGQIDSAIAEFRAAIHIAPHYPDAYLSLSEALAVQGKTDESLAVLRGGLQKSPGEPSLVDAIRRAGGRVR